MLTYSVSAGRVEHSILGIGVNINQSEFINIGEATSLKIILDKEFDLAQLTSDLLFFLNERYALLKAGIVETIENKYNENLYLLKQPKKFKTSKGILKGEIEGVNKAGQLVVKSKSKKHCFNHKEIFFT